MHAFHCTLETHLPSIFDRGLIPGVGQRSQEAREGKPCLYFFPDLQAVEQALLTWLGDAFEEEEDALVILEVDLDGLPVHSAPGSFELTLDVPVSPDRVVGLFNGSLQPAELPTLAKVPVAPVKRMRP